MHREPLNFHAYEDDLLFPAGASFKSDLLSHEFCSRLHSSFLIAQAEFEQLYGDEISTYWDNGIVGNRRSDILHAVKAKTYNKSLRYILSNPIRHNLWYGFDNTAKHFSSSNQSPNPYQIYDVLLRFYEAAGGRLHQEERLTPAPYLDIEKVIDFIEDALKVDIIFPAPYARMTGLISERGIIRTRALWGLYLAWRSNQLKANSVLELGGGLGYAAFYSSLFGVSHYTIVDLPLTLIASGHFLASCGFEKNIKLYGLPDKEHGREASGIKFDLIPPQGFPVNHKYDLVINMDSFPEFGESIARVYANKIKKVSKKFLSINHEGEKYTVRELFINDPDVINYTRTPFWLRKGYVEEIFEFK